MQTGSFDQIYQNYFDSVYRYALSLSGNPQAAEEIAQETFFKAMRTPAENHIDTVKPLRNLKKQIQKNAFTPPHWQH